MRNRKMKGAAQSMPIALSLGLAVSIAVTLTLSAAIAYLVLNETINESAIGYGVMSTVLTSALFGAMIAASAAKRRRLFVCFVSGVIYYLALLSVTALFFGGQYEGMGVTGLLVFGGVGTAALIGGKRETNGGRKRRKVRIR